MIAIRVPRAADYRTRLTLHLSFSYPRNCRANPPFLIPIRMIPDRSMTMPVPAIKYPHTHIYSLLLYECAVRVFSSSTCLYLHKKRFHSQGREFEIEIRRRRTGSHTVCQFFVVVFLLSKKIIAVEKVTKS